MKRVSAVIAGIFWVATSVCAQDLPAAHPDTLAGGKLQPRSEIMPYATRDEALNGDEGASAYIIPLDEWQSETLPEGIRYTTRFKVPYQWNDRGVIFRIEGATSSFSVMLNGRPLGYSQSGMGRMEFDFSKTVEENYNTVSVILYNRPAVAVLESGRDHSMPSFRRAFIISQPKVRIRDLVVDTEISGRQGMFSLGVVMKSDLLNPKTFTISYELIAPTGEVVAGERKDLNTTMLSEDTVTFFAPIPEVRGWSHEAPYLYTLIVKSRYEGRDKEYVAVKIGFRDAAFADGTLTINGTPVPLHMATASYEGDQDKTLATLLALKRQGVNCVLVEGHPQPDVFYYLCDKAGLYVCDRADIDTSGESSSIAKGGNPTNDPIWAAAYTDRALEMYHLSKLHPSVVLFSLADSSQNGYCLYESYLALKSVERKRAVVYPEAGGQWNSDAIRFLPPSEATDTGITVTTENLSYPERLSVNNEWLLTPVEGELDCKVKVGRRVKNEEERAVTLNPGSSLVVDVPIALVGDGKKRSVEVTFTIPKPIYEYDPARSVTTKTCWFKRVFCKKKLRSEENPRITLVQEELKF